MGKIGKKKKPTGAAPAGANSSENYTKKINSAAVDLPRSGAGFNENDIEFMKKAI
jgi:hypothetical protein